MTTTRRDFLQTTGGALAGLAFVGCELMAAAPARAQGRRREVVVSGKRAKTVDVHAHCAVPEALALMNLKLGGPLYRPDLDMATAVAARLRAMDEQGIDVEALSINPNWYETDRDLARRVIQIQNEKLAEACAANPERFVAFATVALQYPDLAAEQLEEGVKKYGLRGAGIGGSVNGAEISDPKFHPFWAKAEQLGVVVFIHPQGTGAPTDLQHRLKGSGYLENVIGNPLETTVATSHLIFDGVLERHPKLKVVLPHAGGYLTHYWARMDHAWKARPDCHTVIKQKPSSYLEKFYFDTITFDHGMLAPLIARFGAEHVLLGTDYPYDMGMERPIEFIEGVKGLSKAQAAAIEGGNAARLLKIDYNAAQRRRS